MWFADRLRAVRPLAALASLSVAATLVGGGCGGHTASDHDPLWSGRLALSVNRAGGSALELLSPGGSPALLTSVVRQSADRSPSWAPDGRTIVFSSNRSDPVLHTADATEIYTVTVPGGRLVRLTHNRVYDDLPVFSPDGSRIAFVHQVGEKPAELWVMNADGSGTHRLTTDLGVAERVSWSPDSGRIAYACLSPSATSNPTGIGEGGDVGGSGDDADNTDICTISASGRGHMRITPDPIARDSQPAWSHDGTEIAFIRGRASIDEVAAGGGPVHTIRSAGLGGGWAFPSWSANGRTILALDRTDLTLRLLPTAGGWTPTITTAELTAAPAWWQPNVAAVRS
jgi:Tol biopolymer transport system component